MITIKVKQALTLQPQLSFLKETFENGIKHEIRNFNLEMRDNVATKKY